MSVDKKRQAILFAAWILIYSEQSVNSVTWACKLKKKQKLVYFVVDITEFDTRMKLMISDWFIIPLLDK